MHLVCETAERCLSRTDFRWSSTTTLLVEQNGRLLSAWNFPGYCLAHFQSENTLKKVVLPPNISKQGAFFLSKS